MSPFEIVAWAFGLGIAWVIFARFIGFDEWLKSRFGKAKVTDLEARVQKLEKRLDEIEKQKPHNPA